MKLLNKYNKIAWLYIFIISLSLFVPNIASGNDKYIKIAGCYSNMYYNEEGGDVLGFEFIIIYSVKGYYVLYQSSEGEPAVPKLLPVVIKDTSLSFMLPSEDSRHGEFNGTLTSNGLTGKFSKTGEQIELKRKASYWQ